MKALIEVLTLSTIPSHIRIFFDYLKYSLNLIILLKSGSKFCNLGLPEYIRSDNGSEFTAKKVRKFIRNLGALPAFIEPGIPWENGYIESFNGKMRDELLNCEIFDTMQEAKMLIER